MKHLIGHALRDLAVGLVGLAELVDPQPPVKPVTWQASPYSIPPATITGGVIHTELGPVAFRSWGKWHETG